MHWPLVLLIRVYQLVISPMLRAAFGNVCRFEPSCSHYAIGALKNRGALEGSWLAFVRICKCQPFHPGGYDPPPPPRHPKGAEGVQAKGSSCGCEEHQPASEDQPPPSHPLTNAEEEPNGGTNHPDST